MKRLARSPRRVVAQASSLAATTSRAARGYRTSPMRIVRLARQARTIGGFEYEEALAFGLLDPETTPERVAQHSSKHATLEAQRVLNPEALAPLTEEKAISYRLLEAFGVPSPPLLGIVGHRTGSSRDGRVIASFAAFVDWLPTLPDSFVVKPSSGALGEGVQVIARKGPRLMSGGDGEVSAASLYATMTGDPAFPLWVIQGRVRNGPEMDFLGGADAVQTARLVTAVHPDGTISIAHASMRLAAPGSVVNNYRSGTTGNAFTLIDADGRLGPVWSRRANGCGFQHSRRLPSTGRVIEGRAIPAWDDAVAMVRRAAVQFLPIRTIGWDVAFTADGPTVLEGNCWWDPPPMPDVGAAVAHLFAPTADT